MNLRAETKVLHVFCCGSFRAVQDLHITWSNSDSEVLELK